MNEVLSLLGTEEKQRCCQLSPYNFSSRNKTNKQTNKQSNLLSLTVSFDKRSCLNRD